MTFKALLYCVVFSSTLSACSSKELYNAGTINKESHCNIYVGHEHEQCLKDVNPKSYEIYEQERQQVIKGEVDQN